MARELQRGGESLGAEHTSSTRWAEDDDQELGSCAASEQEVSASLRERTQQLCWICDTNVVCFPRMVQQEIPTGITACLSAVFFQDVLSFCEACGSAQGHNPCYHSFGI